MNLESLQKSLCSAFCDNVSLYESQGHIVVPLPLLARDGDGLNVYLKSIAAGWRITDLGTTMMRLSYDFDLDKLKQGSRGKTISSIVAETGVKEESGEIYTEVPADRLIEGIFSIGQAASRVADISLWTRARTESTFMEDLKETLMSIVPPDKIHAEYYAEGIPNTELYPIDFMIESVGRPLYIMGVPTKEKAKSVTITFQHLLSHQHDFESIAVFSNVDEIPKIDLKRLMVAANDMVPSLSDISAFKRKIEHRLTR